MLTGLIGKKLRMTQLWLEDGRIVPVTVLQMGPCRVLQVKTGKTKDRYQGVQIGFDELPRRKARHPKEWYEENDRYTGTPTPRGTKPARGHVKRWGGEDAFRVIHEVGVHPGARLEATLAEGNEEESDTVRPGRVYDVSLFEGVKMVDVTSTSKGRGFQGCIKRHNYGRGPKSHGSKNIREPGSTGMCQTPGRIFKGKKMAGQMGSKRCTVRNLSVVKVEPALGLLYVRGGVPGHTGAYVLVRKGITERNAPVGAAAK